MTATQKGINPGPGCPMLPSGMEADCQITKAATMKHRKAPARSNRFIQKSYRLRSFSLCRGKGEGLVNCYFFSSGLMPVMRIISPQPLYSNSMVSAVSLDPRKMGGNSTLSRNCRYEGSFIASK